MQKGVVTMSVEWRGGRGNELHETCLGTHVAYLLLCLQSSTVPDTWWTSMTCPVDEYTWRAKVWELSDLMLSTVSDPDLKCVRYRQRPVFAGLATFPSYTLSMSLLLQLVTWTIEAVTQQVKRLGWRQHIQPLPLTQWRTSHHLSDTVVQLLPHKCSGSPSSPHRSAMPPQIVPPSPLSEDVLLEDKNQVLSWFPPSLAQRVLPLCLWNELKQGRGAMLESPNSSSSWLKKQKTKNYKYHPLEGFSLNSASASVSPGEGCH